MRLKIFNTFAVTLLLSGCGGGGGSSIDAVIDTPTVNTATIPSTGSVTMSGTVTYDLVPSNPNSVGLDYDNIRREAVKGVLIDAINSSNQSVASTITDASGHYSFSVPNNTQMKIRVSAKMLQTITPSWDVKVVDNTNSNALYAMEGALSSSGTADSQRHLNASSGWGGTAYTSSRTAAPFAVLDNAYHAIQKVLSANANTTFPPLVMNWSINNVSIPGNTSLGQITTSHYSDGNLFILGDADSDTDEYDDHVVTHEWGHYYEDKFSRSDSIGGPHGGEDTLDIRVALGEGWGNAFSGMALDDPVYFDTLGISQASGFNFDVESGTSTNKGWYSESSIQRILYDLYDSNDDGSDILSMGFAPIHQVFTGAEKITPAFTSIFTFITALKAENDGDADEIDSIVSSESIEPINDIYGTGRANLPSELPEYVDLVVGNTVNVCPTYTYGTYNKLGNRKYIRFTIDTAGNYTIRVRKSNSTSTTDPDFLLYNVSLSSAGITEVIDSETLTTYLNTANYKLDVSDYKNISGACFDVTVD